MNSVQSHKLPVGYKLQNYRILDVLGEGGFGITYLAQDEVLEQRVAIKEYFPGSLTNRNHDTQAVQTVNAEAQNIFQWGLDRFLTEARILAQLNHPNIVRVLYFTSLNNTGYMVMQYEEGEPLDKWVKRYPDNRMPQAEVIALLDPITEALKVVHDLGIAHRDVKPANIYIRSAGTPVLLDFGAARNTVSGKSKTVAAIVSSGYSPMEQYSDVAEQGPWTDIYATAGVAYKLICAETPPDAPSRIDAELSERADPCRKLAQENLPGFDKSFLTGIDHGLAVRAKDRPQSIPEWREILGFDKTEPQLDKTVLFDRPDDRSIPQASPALVGKAGQSGRAGARAAHAPSKSKSMAGPIVGGLSVLALAAIGGWFVFDNLKDTGSDDIGDTFDTALDLGTLTSTLKTVSDRVGGDDTKDVIKFKLERSRLVQLEASDLPSGTTIVLKAANGDDAYAALKEQDKLIYKVDRGEQALIVESDRRSERDYKLELKAEPLTPDTDDVEKTNKRPPSINLGTSSSTTRNGILWGKGEERAYTLRNDDTTDVKVTFDAKDADATLNIIDDKGLGFGRIDGKNGPLVARLPKGNHRLVATSRQDDPLRYAFTLTPSAIAARRTAQATLAVPGYLTKDQALIEVRNKARAALVTGKPANTTNNGSSAEADLASLEQGIPYDETWTTNWTDKSSLSAKLEARVRKVDRPDAFTASLSDTTIRAMEPFDVTLSSASSDTLFIGVYAWGADGNVVRVFPIGVNTAPMSLAPRATSKLSDNVDRLISAPLPGQRESREAVVIASCASKADFVSLAPAAGANVGQSIAQAVSEADFFDKLSSFCPENLGFKVLPYTVVTTGNP
ncbi:MAG: serine/threonine-protein kinase [Pseudomonadota bacterium]